MIAATWPSGRPTFSGRPWRPVPPADKLHSSSDGDRSDSSRARMTHIGSSLVSRKEDPVLRHARREGLIIISAWAAATAYCCLDSYFFGYIRPDRPLGPVDIP